ALEHVYQLALDYLTGLPERPVGQHVTAEQLAAKLDEPLPELGRDPAGVLDEWLAKAEAGIVASPGPRFFGFVNGGSTPAARAGGLTSGTTMANLTGLAAGREWVGRQLGFNPALDGLGGQPAIPVIASTEIHASARKALGTLGLGRAAVRTVPAPGGSIDLA